jgi:hypothetical protein
MNIKSPSTGVISKIKSPSTGIISKIREDKNNLQITIKTNLLDSQNQYCPIFGEIGHHKTEPSKRLYLKTEINSPIGVVTMSQYSSNQMSSLRTFVGRAKRINTSEKFTRISYGSETKISIPKGNVEFSKKIKKGLKVVGGITDLGHFEYS